ncbi:MAG TPA: alanine racemase [Bryobacteraceae bacterium]|nr:alanine racemase [Bryobacteraceae bacterium]
MTAGFPRSVAELDTPAILIDLDVMERNLRRVAGYAQQHGLRLRPHTKTHKIPALARNQLQLGAAGLTVAKVGEAEVMLQAEPAELLLAFPIVGRQKLERLMQVARNTSVTVSLDSLEAARQLSEAAEVAHIDIGVLAETDVGLGRVGVVPGEPLRQLIEEISRLPNLRWEGVAFYPGQIKTLDEAGERQLAKLAELLDQMLSDLARAGLKPRIVSGGSTPTLFCSHRLPGVNEVRPGTYIFNDRNTVLSGACAWEDCAASILVTVVSTAKPGQMIVDGGSKTFSSDRPSAGAEVSFGRVVEAPEAVFTRMNEEHGFVELRDGRQFAVGDRVRIIPNHVCVAMNLHECVYGVRNGAVEQVWRVEARGKLQ